MSRSNRQERSQNHFSCEACGNDAPDPPFLFVDVKMQTSKRMCKDCYNLAVMRNYME